MMHAVIAQRCVPAGSVTKDDAHHIQQDEDQNHGPDAAASFIGAGFSRCR